MKAKLTFEIPNEIVNLFVDHGIKKEDVVPLVKALIGTTVQTILEQLPTVFLGFRAGAIDFEDVLKQWVNHALKIGEKETLPS